MSAIQVIETNSNGIKLNANEFLSIIRKSNNIWWEDNNDKCSWVFRGQWNDNWKLLPSAWREPNSKLEPLLRKIRTLKQPNNNISEQELKYLLKLNSEIQAVSDFNNLASQLGFNTPEKRPYNPLSQEYLNELTISYIHEHLPLAQHHGIPTRLLDWTDNPIFAAFFAVGREFRTNDYPENICVWAFHKTRISKLWSSKKNIQYSFAINFAFDSNFKNEYQKAQKGLFTRIDGNIKLFYSLYDRFPSLEDVIEILSEDDIFDDPILVKIVLSKNEIENLLELLEREDISIAYLMPSLDKVSETVQARWNYFR